MRRLEKFALCSSALHPLEHQPQVLQTGKQNKDKGLLSIVCLKYKANHAAMLQ